MNKLKVVLDLFDVYDDIPVELQEMKHYYQGDPNFRLIPVTQLKASKENVELFNKIYFWCRDKIKQKIKRTPSGGISIKGMLKYEPQYDVKVWGGLCIELTIVHPAGRWRIQLGSGTPDYAEKLKPMSGHKAYQKMYYYLSREGIDLLDEKYILDKEQAFNVKMSIPKPKIEVAHGIEIGENITYHHCYHADLNQSYGSGLIKAFPEFEPVIRYLYSKRHDENGQYYKDITNMFIGYCQSKNVNYKHSHLSKAAIDFNIFMLNLITEGLLLNGYRPLLYNTDGVWYDSYGAEREPYTNEYTGLDLGQWKNDHLDSDLRIRSAGSYEFRENNVVYVVQRGRTKLDDLKPRDQWAWGDIFDYNNDHMLLLEFQEENGVVRSEK